MEGALGLTLIFFCRLTSSMRWEDREASAHVEDRRGGSGSLGFSSRGGGVLSHLIVGLFMRGGIKTKILLVGAVLFGSCVLHVNPLSLLGLTTTSPRRQAALSQEQSDGMFHYLSVVKGDNERVWAQLLGQRGIAYRPAKMVLYTGRTRTPGGIADAQMGPFYMPANETIYIDPSFFAELATEYRAKGDFAQAYVLSHEVAHHIQKLMGISQRIQEAQKRSPQLAKALSVRLELHADFLAGVFAHHGQNLFHFLEEGDINEAIAAAEGVGDDRIQKRARGYVTPDTFTHGSSAQRKKWFMLGYKTGDIREGDRLYTLPYKQL